MVDEHEADDVVKERESGHITNKMISDILVTCFEGGSNYWVEEVRLPDEVPEGATYASDVPGLGGTIQVVDFEGPRPVDREIMVQGIIMAANYMGLSVEDFYENHDAESADIALQFALFGEIIYG